MENIPDLKLNGQNIPFKDQVKYLGVTFDKKLTWGPHIDNLKKKVKSSLNILKVVSSFDWGSDKKCLLKLYNSICKSKLDYACEVYSSACKTKLGELNVVHNLGLRICTGAYRTSPVESLYIDSNELPLDLRREELGLRYIQRLKSSQGNPARDILKENECNRQLFHKPRSSKPFQVRLLEEVEEPELRSQKVYGVGFLEKPPWLIPEVNCCKKVICKKNISEEEIKAKFLDHDSIHVNQEKIFTDGSKSSDGVGCAIIYNDFVEQAKLPDTASVFTAELSAIIQSLKLIHDSNRSNFVIYSDSFSAITSLRKFNPLHPLIQKAQEWLFRIHIKYKKVQFCWVPSHVGIQQNEEADVQAKEAALLPSVTLKYVPPCDLKSPIRSYILNKWQRRWNSLTSNKKYRKIRKTVAIWPSSYHPNRRFERTLSRLRIGHSHVTHKFLLEGANPPICNYCKVLLTIEHILVECPQYCQQRQHHGMEGKSLLLLLGEDVEIDSLMAFLKDISLFYDI